MPPYECDVNYNHLCSALSKIVALRGVARIFCAGRLAAITQIHSIFRVLIIQKDRRGPWTNHMKDSSFARGGRYLSAVSEGLDVTRAQIRVMRSSGSLNCSGR